MHVPRVQLAPGYAVSRLIKGGWQLAGGHGVVDHGAALRDMSAFVDAGITTFDCADIYTGVEALIGDFLRTRPRDEVQVHTKYVPDLGALGTLTPDDIARTIDRSCQRLRVAALDLVQFHWWDYAIGDCVAAARALATLREGGRIRHIGTTNFSTEGLRAIVSAGVPVIAHQVQYSLLDRRPAGAMHTLCAAHGIELLCYGALAGGFVDERWLGVAEPVEPLENRSLTKYKLIIDACGGWVRFQELLGLLSEISQAHGVRIGAVAIRWVLDQPGVAAVIVGARNAERLPGTVDALRIELGASERERLGAFLDRLPLPAGDVYELERDRSGAHGRIMRYNLGES